MLLSTGEMLFKVQRARREEFSCVECDSEKERVFEYRLRVQIFVSMESLCILSLSEDKFFPTKESLLFP